MMCSTKLLGLFFVVVAVETSQVLNSPFSFDYFNIRKNNRLVWLTYMNNDRLFELLILF